MKKEKTARKLHKTEFFEHTIGDRLVTIGFNLEGTVGEGLVEVGEAIKCPEDVQDATEGIQLVSERLGTKTDSIHYKVVDDVDILDLAAEALAARAVKRIEKWEAEAEVKADAREKAKAIADAHEEHLKEVKESDNAIIHPDAIFDALKEDCEICDHLYLCTLINAMGLSFGGLDLTVDGSLYAGPFFFDVE